MVNNDRYRAQTALPEIGPEGQERLSRARVLVVGAGGLGCPVLQYLAAAGIGALGIIDDDTVDLSNLQRQILFTSAQQGQKKVAAAKERLLALNPDIKVDVFPERLCAANAPPLFEGFDVIVDGTDNFAAKFLINDAAVKLGKPVVYGSILGFEGQASVFWAKRGPCYRCLYPAPPAGYIPNCAEAGVIGALAGIIGSVQAMEVIKLATGHNELAPLIGKLWMIDARTMATHSYSLPKNPQCPVCSKKPEEIDLMDEPAAICAVIAEIDISEARERGDVLFLDVREQNEWDIGHIEGAVLHPLSVLASGVLPDIAQDIPCIVYCRSGKRSRAAIEILIENGFDRLVNLRGGYEAWRNHNQ